eukprot:scaffold78433_cov23-Tisochrysis_lutea.AAC.1
MQPLPHAASTTGKLSACISSCRITCQLSQHHTWPQFTIITMPKGCHAPLEINANAMCMLFVPLLPACAVKKVFLKSEA